MALSGSFTGTTSNDKITAKIVWSATQSVSGNYSNVTATLYYSRTNTGYTTKGTWRGNITINGTEVDLTDGTAVEITYNSNTKAGSATVKVPHNTNGSKTITISADGWINGTSLSSTNISKSITLDTIPRQATISSAPNFTDEANPKITYSNAAGNAVTTLQACISLTGSTDDIAYRDISKTGSSYTFNLTDAERTVLRKATTTAKSRTVYFYVKTIVGGNTYTSRLAKTLTITNATPTLSPSVYDTDEAIIALTGDKNKLVKYYSDVYCSAGAAAVKNATVKTVTITNNSKTVTATTNTFSNVTNASFTFKVTDSRGNTKSQTVTKTMVNYVPLTCNLKTNNPDTAGNMSFTVSGNYFNGSFGSVANTLTVQYRYKENNGSYSSWTTLTATKSGNKYTASKSLTGLNYQSQYTFQARAVDKLATKTTAARKVKTTPIFDWGENDFTFNVDTNLAQGKVLNGIATDGTSYPLAYVHTNNNSIYGYGGYKNDTGSTNIYGNGINLITKTDLTVKDGTATYSLLGAVYALTYGYTLECTNVSLGANYSEAEVTCYLIGNQLRMGLSCTRKEAPNVGNITNETVVTFNIKHDGRLRNLYMVGFVPAATGGTASFYSSAGTAVDANTMQVSINLASTTTASTGWSAYWTIPVTLNLSAYV